MLIANNRVVAFHYTLTNERGEKLDTSRGGLPLLYLHGHGNLLRGLEQALEGRSSGDRFTVTVAPELGYGERDAELVQRVPRAALDAAGVIEAGVIEVGMQLQAHSADGELPVRVIAVDTDSVTVDGNHPLAGETLVFDVEVRNVRDAEQEELETGFADA